MSFSVSMARRQESQIQQWVGLSATAWITSRLCGCLSGGVLGEGTRQALTAPSSLYLLRPGVALGCLLLSLPSQTVCLSRLIATTAYFAQSQEDIRQYSWSWSQRTRRKGVVRTIRVESQMRGSQSPCSCSPLPFQRGRSLAENSCL